MSNSPWKLWQKDGYSHLPFPDIDIYSTSEAPYVIQSLGTPLTQNYIRMPGHTIILLTRFLCFPAWHTELGPPVTRTASIFNLIFYSDQQVLCAICLWKPPIEDPCLVAFLPFVKTIYNISRMLLKHNMKVVGILPKKVSSFFQPVTCDLALKKLGFYIVPC
jgi:hypothetical protein